MFNSIDYQNLHRDYVKRMIETQHGYFEGFEAFQDEAGIRDTYDIIEVLSWLGYPKRPN